MNNPTFFYHNLSMYTAISRLLCSLNAQAFAKEGLGVSIEGLLGNCQFFQVAIVTREVVMLTLGKDVDLGWLLYLASLVKINLVKK